MKRRDISRALLAGAAGAVVLADASAAQVACTTPCYPSTPAEGSTVRNPMYPPGDVRRYGADPTGKADSTEALKDAIASGCSLFFPDGVFLSTGGLKPKSRTTWYGTGVLKAAADVETLVLIDDVMDFEFAIDTDMTLGKPAQRIAVAANKSSIFTIRDGCHRGGTIVIGVAAGCESFTIRDNVFIEAAAGNSTSSGAILINARSRDFEIRNNRIAQAAGSGIAIYNGSSNGIITKNTCTRCLGNGIYVNSARFLLIEGNICNGNGHSGIGFNASAPDTYGFPAQCSIIGNICADNIYDGIDYNLAVGGNRHSTLSIISGNILSNNGTAKTGGTGMYLANADRTTITGNAIEGNNLEGIFLNGCQYCNVSGNTVVSNGRNAPNRSDGIAINGSMNNVTGNTSTNGIAANQRYGIGEQGDADRNNIVGNHVMNNATGSMFIVGKKTTVQNNQR